MDINELVVKIKADISNLQANLEAASGHLKQFGDGAEGATKKTENMTGAFVKGALIVDVLKKAFNFLVNQVKDSVKEATEHEQVQVRLNAALQSTGQAAGLSAKAINSIAENLKTVTGIEDDTIVKTETLLLRFTSIGKDVFPRATAAILDTAQALGRDFAGVAQVVGRALENPIAAMRTLRSINVLFTDDQKKMVEQLQRSGDLMGAQKIILNQLEKSYGGTAAALRNTFGGAVMALQSNLNELKEKLGGLFTTIAKPIVEALNKIVIAVNAFLDKKENLVLIQKIIGGVAVAFQILWTVGKALVENVFKMIEAILTPIINLFKELFMSSEDNNDALTIMVGALKILGMILFNVGQVLKTAIQLIIDIGKAAWESGKLISAFFASLITGKWEIFNKQAESAGNAWKSLAVNLVNNVKDTWEGMKDRIIDLATTTGKEAANLRKDLEKTFKTFADPEPEKQVKELAKNIYWLNDGVEALTDAEKANLKAQSEAFKAAAANAKTLEEKYNYLKQALAKERELAVAEAREKGENVQAVEQKYAEELKRLETDQGEEIAEINKKAAQDTLKAWIDAAQTVGNTMKSVLSDIGTAISNYYDNLKQQVEDTLDQQLDAIDEQEDQQLKQYDADRGAKKRSLQQKIADLQAAIAAETNAQKKADLQAQLDAAQRELAILNIEEQAQAQREAAQEEAARQQAQIEYDAAHAAWEIQLVNAIATAALAVLGGLATQPFVPAGIIAGAAAAIAGVAQVAVVAYNEPKMPSFAAGGTMPYDGLALVGEQGPELRRLPAGTQIVNNQETKQMLGNSGNTFNFNSPKALDPAEADRLFRRSMREMRFKGHVA